MKISVAYDQHGKIMAASLMSVHSKRQIHPASMMGSTDVLDVPAEFHGKELREILHHLKVDVAARRLVKK
jgi:hypothetical protein